MNTKPSLPTSLILGALCLCLVAVPEVRAQSAILENGYRNGFGGSPPAAPGGVDVPVPGEDDYEAYQAQGQNFTTFGGFPTAGYGTLRADPATTTPVVIPANQYPLTPPTVVPQNSPNNSVTGGSAATVFLRSAIIGRPLLLFKTTYNFGGVIEPPEKTDIATGQPLAFRAEPLNSRIMTPVNSIQDPTPNGDPVIPAVDGVQDGVRLVNGIAYIVGTNPEFYWSKHAEQVYATQPGNITVEWREAGNSNSIKESYVIATAPAKPERTLYWTENGSTGPLIDVPSGKLNQVNFIYNSLVPADVALPDKPWLSGTVDPSETDPAKKRYKTVYYENNLIHAYNVQGRVFLEYLGEPQGDGTSVQKGYEIVNVVKEPIARTQVVDLGEKLLQFDLKDDNGAPVTLTPKVLVGLGLTGEPSIHQQVTSGGTETTLYAIRETQPGTPNINKTLDNSVLVYWMETAQLDLKWPKQYVGYVQQWPETEDRYSIYARPDSGAVNAADPADTAVQLDSSNNPALVYQDDLAKLQAQLLPGNRFYTRLTLAPAGNAENKALLRFTKDDDIWFERVWSKLDVNFQNYSGVTQTVGTLSPGQDPTVLTTPFTSLTVTDANNPGTVYQQGVDYTLGVDVNGGNIFEAMYHGASELLDQNFDPGPNGPVHALLVQPGDRKVLVGGNFTTLDGQPRNHIGRLNPDGSIDLTFDPGAGANGLVQAMAVQSDGKILVIGDFDQLGGQPRNRIGRLNTDGSIDLTFDPGTGVDDYVRALVLQPDGKIVVGGNFSSLDGQARNRVGRLNPDGSVDPTFDPGAGADNIVNALALQPDGKILVGGYFATLGGLGRNRVGRLNPDGTPDAGFDPGTGANSYLNALALQPDGKVILGGNFSTLDGQSRERIARLNPDGSLDTGFVPQAGTDAFIFRLALQPDGKVVVGGNFTTLGGESRSHIGRLETDGSVDLNFNPGGAGADQLVRALTFQPDGKLIAGGDFTLFGGTPRLYLARLLGDSRLPVTLAITYTTTAFAEIGKRIEPDASFQADRYGDSSPVHVGYIHRPRGTAYNVNAYKNPFIEGFDEAAKGAIIPVNNLAGNSRLEVWWYKKSKPGSAKLNPTYWPSFVQSYELKWPASPDRIVLASNAGSNDLPSLQATGEIYTRNIATEDGYNPNEEHALMLNGRAWALRDDLNIATSSKPYVLLHYTEADQRPAMRVFEVLREDNTYKFNYPAVAGTILQAPMPLPLLAPPRLASDIPVNATTTLKAGTLASYEVAGEPDPLLVPGDSTLTSADSAFAHYRKFTWADRKGIPWVYRGPHQGNVTGALAPGFKMRYFYKTLPGFHFPGVTQPAIGTMVPYLREKPSGPYPAPTLVQPANQPPSAWIDQPLAVTYTPQWPASAPELRIGETLTLPKYGLPQVRGQQSAEFIYQQSVATDPAGGDLAARQRSARLFDPTRAKIYHFGGAASPASEVNNLPAIPDSVNTSNYLGKTYFPNLPPHLSSRLYFDPAVGPYGSLVFKGVFMNEQVGEKYLQLNVMSVADINDAKSLTPADPPEDKQKWDAAIDGLATTMETFVEDPGKLGTFIPLRNESVTPRLPIVIDGIPRPIDPSAEPLAATAPAGSLVGAIQRPAVLANELAEVFYSDTAVDSYAVSASGGGDGFVVLALGNGQDTDFTDKGGPVSLQVFKVTAPLYRGELKVVNSQNPLDEKLTLQHTGDFAGRPEQYDFEWRYGPPVDGLPPKLYSFVHKDIIRDSTSAWQLIHNPTVNSLDPSKDYSKYRELGTGISDVVRTIDVTSGGSGYTAAPSVAITGGNGSAATAVANLSPAFNSVKVTQGGTGYVPGTTFVTIEGGGGQGALATAVVDGGIVTGITVIDPGSNYTSPPIVTITGAGEGARAVAAFGVESVSLTGQGIGYTAVPNVDFSGGGGPGAHATATTGDALYVDPASMVINDGHGTAAHGSTLPHALLRRTFTTTAQPMRLFLSLDLGSNDGAIVYLNNARVASYHVPGHEDSPTTSVPATAPPFEPLSRVFEIDANVLKTDGSGDNNVVTVELYTSADAASTTAFNLRLEGSQEVENLLGWLPVDDAADDPLDIVATSDGKVSPPTTIKAVKGKNRYTIQGSSILTLSDNYIIMRYRPRAATNAAYQLDNGVPVDWSKWTEPQLAEGWIKRVLAGINPFQQRVKDLFNHETNTSVSLVEQAGKRWEGDIALNLDNINDSGLVEIYETVLRRGKDLSINAGINYGGANDALLLAAGYLSDLYMILGNEAYADAANSTIAFNTAGEAAQYGDVATALFSFKGQLATVLDEELSLLRGRDDSLLPGTQKSPIYNRLIWNYTRGIDSGEAIYALNYNIKDRIWDLAINPNNIGGLPTDGIISAADAAISYPQGHGDAYGHYLTAITGYYGLLNNPNFSWTPRIEAVLVLGTPVSVDYQDERKFAAAAASVARSASRTLDLTYRQEFSASEDAGWSDLHDEKGNPNTGRTRNWGTDDWATRGGQGALFHWATANSLLPAVDPNPNHSGIQKIDRTTVPELAEIASQAAAIQQTLDHADARVNPLGLAAGALAFDISPTEVDAGKTHFEQIYERATVALTNAVSAFNNAKGSTQFLRRQEDTLADQRNAIDAQEQAFTNQLIELYGTPYTDDIGPGKTYKQDYEGPDLLGYMLVDLPEVFSNGMDTKTFDLLLSPTFVIENPEAFQFELNPVFDAGPVYTYTLSARGDVMKPDSWTGRRVSPGKMQTAVSDLLIARQDLEGQLDVYSRLDTTINEQIALYESAVTAYSSVEDYGTTTTQRVATLASLKLAALVVKQGFEKAEKAAEKATEAAAAAIPEVAGVAVSAGSPGKGAALVAGIVGVLSSKVGQSVQEALIEGFDDAIERINFLYQANVTEAQFAEDIKQLLHDLHFTLVELKRQAGDVDVAIRRLDQAQRDIYSLQAEGNRIQKSRLVFRQHAAAIIQGYRTRDFAFRAFRDEALERYNALFDLSARYTYMAARAYDYETGLLDANGNASATGFYEKVVQARALGVVSNGQPQFSGASTGDPGLSGVLAELDGDWSVVKSRLGFNNPDRYTTTFSLRTEKERILPGADGDLEWKDMLSGNKMANILDDPDVKRFCMQVADSNGNAVPGIVIPFSTTIETGLNFFGRPLAGGDHTFTPSSFSTKIRSSGIALSGYVGMDSPTTTSGTLGGIGATSPGDPNTGFNSADALSATPYIYLIPAGADSMRSPPLGDTSFVRTWAVQDQAIPLPFNIANSDYSTQPAWVSAASLSEPPFTLRKHQAFRAVPDGTNFQGGYGFTNARLIGRSAWNSQWKIVIPGNTLLNDPNLGINTFIRTVKDIKLHLETYSYSGN